MSIDIILLTKKKPILRLDVFPFIIIYLGFFYHFLEGDEIYSRLIFLAIVLTHCITYLTNFWSARANSWIEYSRLPSNQKNIGVASHVRISSTKKGRNTIYEICPLEKEVQNDKTIYFFHFHKKKYVWDEDKKTFNRIKPRIDQPIKVYKETKRNINDLQYYDKNSYEIPMPEFKKLLRDQLIEPFSFFQFFSVALWLLDENRFYSLLTLFMIFMSSCMVAMQRMRTMWMLRKMALNPQYIYTYRNNKWTKISSEDLKPGDICAIQTSNNITVMERKPENFLAHTPLAQFLPPKLKELPQKQESDENHKVLPCDFIILSGSCVVNESILTGESIPQIKDSIKSVENDEEILDIKNKHKNRVLFCGTEVIQVFSDNNLPPQVSQKPPVDSCIAYVLKTGFETAKGKLTRTVLFNNENLNIKQGEAFILIFILLLFSIWSSVNILIQGLDDPDRDKNKLFLRCILIITTVVPPELPMILTIAVNSSLVYLQRKKIFCTEPFRIPLAGKVSVCAFDKTGTLTKDELIYRGIVEDLSQDPPVIQTSQDSLKENTLTILAGCHSLVNSHGKLLGDPIEKAIFEAYNWKYSTTEKLSTFGNKKVRIVQLFPFQSELKRMSSVISYFEDDIPKDFRVVVKGAPETIEKLLSEVPKNYEQIYRHYAKKGYRVLALASKVISSISDITRDTAESNLTFSGFILFNSPLKKDTKHYIGQLSEANYKVIMITGDSELTAANVSEHLSMGSKKHLFLEYNSENKLIWYDEDHNVECEYSQNQIKTISKTSSLCVTGNVLKAIVDTMHNNEIKELLKHITVFARVSPSQKEYIVHILRSAGERVLMCGDGTNDVGALKKSDVGLALVGLNDPPQKTPEEKKRRKEEKARRPFGNPQDDLFGDMPTYKPGDASIAAPFTSKHSNSTVCVPIVLKQGVCTMVTTFQTYKILAMTCLISAYSMSALHMQKTKYSETQSTIMGILGAFNYYYYSNAKPMKVLSKIKPPTTIFEPYFIFSVAGQVLIQLYFMDVIVRDIGLKYSSEEELKLLNEEEFKPTFLNTVVFLHTIIAQTSIFLFNYGGKPFMESLSDNKKYFKILIFTMIGSFLLALNGSEDLSWAADLSFYKVPEEAIFELVKNLFYMVIINYVYEKTLKFLKFRKFFDFI